LYVTVTSLSQLSVAVGEPADGTASHCTVVLAGTNVNPGVVLSITVIVWLAVEVLLQSSVAVHFLVTLYAFVQVPGVVASLNVSDGDKSTASDAVGDEKDGVFGQLIVEGPPTPLITGGITSIAIDTLDGGFPPIVAVHPPDVFVPTTVYVPTAV
jgi:hypothetical protein